MPPSDEGPDISQAVPISSRRVRVCVIDTGLDMAHPAVQAAKLEGRLKSVQSWKGSTMDEYGHGTHAAELILRVAPQADLYVAKVANAKSMPSEDTELIIKVG